MAVTLTITDVSKRAGVSRRTIGRMIAEGRLEAVQDSSGVWRITPAQVLAAGLPLDRNTPTETPTAPVTDETERLRAELVEWRTRAQVAEAIATERGAILDDLRQALAMAQRTLTTGTDVSVSGVTLTSSTARRRWWPRRSQR